ncbi:MAG: hypothetical protein OJF61_001676 [Rhodanobacteraceae bacterium]|nr:MAG: hypothetical protein OJF61_001676 [Rhodanobacteraceae bacterium]
MQLPFAILGSPVQLARDATGIAQALIEPPNASRDSPLDCRKRSAFDQLSYIHH